MYPDALQPPRPATLLTDRETPASSPPTTLSTSLSQVGQAPRHPALSGEVAVGSSENNASAPQTVVLTPSWPATETLALSDKQVIIKPVLGDASVSTCVKTIVTNKLTGVATIILPPNPTPSSSHTAFVTGSSDPAKPSIPTVVPQTLSTETNTKRPPVISSVASRQRVPKYYQASLSIHSTSSAGAGTSNTSTDANNNIIRSGNQNIKVLSNSFPSNPANNFNTSINNRTDHNIHPHCSSTTYTTPTVNNNFTSRVVHSHERIGTRIPEELLTIQTTDFAKSYHSSQLYNNSPISSAGNGFSSAADATFDNFPTTGSYHSLTNNKDTTGILYQTSRPKPELALLGSPTPICVDIPSQTPSALPPFCDVFDNCTPFITGQLSNRQPLSQLNCRQQCFQQNLQNVRDTRTPLRNNSSGSMDMDFEDSDYSTLYDPELDEHSPDYTELSNMPLLFRPGQGLFSEEYENNALRLLTSDSNMMDFKSEPLDYPMSDTDFFSRLESSEFDSDEGSTGYESSSTDPGPPQYTDLEETVNINNYMGRYSSERSFSISDHPPESSFMSPQPSLPQQIYTSQASCDSDKGLDETYVTTEENLPDFGKLQDTSVEEAKEPTPSGRSSVSSSLKQKKKQSRESPALSDKSSSSDRKKPGRKKGQVSNVLHLWEFMRDLLKDPARRGNIIEWISEKDGVFRVVDSAAVARLWGEKKKNKKEMTYEKMSRSLRYSRLEGYFSDLPKDKNYPKKLCFKFGPKSKDWY